MTESDWVRTADKYPPKGEVVHTMDSSGRVQPLIFERNLWWFPDRSMYVYYVPMFWRTTPEAR
jgi:hypothetical protein